MSIGDLRSGLARTGIIVLTIALTWGALLMGRVSTEVELRVGQASPQLYQAPGPIEVVDEEATQARRQFAYNNTPTEYTIDQGVTNQVVAEIDRFFLAVRELAQPVAGSDEPTEAPPVTEAPAEEGSEEEAEATTTTTTTSLPESPPREEQIALLIDRFPQYDSQTIETMVTIANQADLEVADQHLSRMRDEAVGLAQAYLRDGIRPTELNAIRRDLLTSPEVILLPIGLPVDTETARATVSDVVAESLRENEFVDEALTEQARQRAAAAVEPVASTWEFGQPIVREGETITERQLEALHVAGLLQQPDSLGIAALLAVVTLLVLVLAFYLRRFRPDFWARSRRVTLFGLFIVLAALGARALAVLLLPEWPVLLYLVPAAAIGFMVAVLFDARMAVLTSVAVGTLTGLAVHDPEQVTGALGYALFAMLATLVPVPFVSAISSRGEFRKAVLFTGLALAPMAGTIAWLFQGRDLALEAVGVGLVSGLLSGVLAQGMLPLFENLFDITTTLTLLDLTDRNHPGLQLLEETALGTFNHSLMVGTLADAAARAVGANPLLARAAAYYHDLGKTENPWFFIENQFGGINPHDSMPPEESAEIIRQHVLDGMRLAGELRIPSEVAEGVLAHHGTGLMRFFYHKALERYGESAVDPEDYRHRGHKPASREMTILMLSDAVEGACRAMVLHEEPTAEGIRSTIEKVVDEKVADGQLDESELTLGDLRAVKDAFAASLVGHYHQRIPYPGFPEDQRELEAERARRRARALEPGADLPGP